ncbi:MAG: GIY-YIG nuclease family protein [Chloroflexota bacterium]
MFLEKMTSRLAILRPKYGIGQFCIHFMRIFARWLKPVEPDLSDKQEVSADSTPRWSYVVQYYLGDGYSGGWHQQSGVVVEGNYFRAQATVTALIQDQHPAASFILILEFERINKPEKCRKVKRAQPTGPGFLYLLEGRPGEYKIGLSVLPKRRISMLGVQLPFSIEVIHLIETNNMLAAERQLHERFASRKINGEWYALAEADVTYIRSIARIDTQ